LGVGTILWALIPALSLGFLAPVPFAYGAVRLRQRRLWAVTAAYAVGVVALFVFSDAPNGSWGDAVFGTVLVALMLGGTTHALVLRRRVFTPAPAPATAAALAPSNQDEDAGAIATGVVAPAGELRVGHPELLRQVDDGGLVDVNHVPEQVLVDRLGLSPAQAGQVVQARERLGGFAGAEDLVAGSGLPVATVDALRERLRFGAVQRATDTHDDRSERPSPEDAKGVPSPGWYPDPAGGPGRRWWDGAHRADQVALSSTPPAKRTSRSLAVVFFSEFLITLFGSFFVFFVTLMGAGGCYSSSCFDHIERAAMLLVFGWPALLVVCLAMFLVGTWKKRVELKRWAVWALPIGTAMIWVVWLVLIDNL
jgi:hypothetical protein